MESSLPLSYVFDKYGIPLIFLELLPYFLNINEHFCFLRNVTTEHKHLMNVPLRLEAVFEITFDVLRP